MRVLTKLRCQQYSRQAAHIYDQMRKLNQADKVPMSNNSIQLTHWSIWLFKPTQKRKSNKTLTTTVWTTVHLECRVTAQTNNALARTRDRWIADCDKLDQDFFRRADIVKRLIAKRWFVSPLRRKALYVVWPLWNITFLQTQIIKIQFFLLLFQKIELDTKQCLV